MFCTSWITLAGIWIPNFWWGNWNVWGFFLPDKFTLRQTTPIWAPASLCIWNFPLHYLSLFHASMKYIKYLICRGHTEIPTDTVSIKGEKILSCGSSTPIVRVDRLVVSQGQKPKGSQEIHSQSFPGFNHSLSSRRKKMRRGKGRFWSGDIWNSISILKKLIVEQIVETTYNICELKVLLNYACPFNPLIVLGVTCRMIL